MSQSLIPMVLGAPPSSFFYILPIVVIHLVTLLYIAALHTDNKISPRELGKAVYVQILLAFGVMLIISGALPFLFSLFSATRLSLEQYAAITIMIAVGVMLLIVLSKRVCSKLNKKAAIIPRSIYHCTFYVLGAIICVESILSFFGGLIAALMVDEGQYPSEWWAMPISFFVIGTGILLFFRYATEGKFQSLYRK